MSENELKQRIAECENKVQIAYSDFTNSATRAGNNALAAVQRECDAEIAEVKQKRMLATLIPVGVSLIGFAFGVLIGIIVLGIGIFVAYKLREKRNVEVTSVTKECNNKLETVRRSKENLDTIISNNAKI